MNGSSRQRRAIGGGFLAVVALGLCGAPASAGNINYTYDNLGRVVSASYPNGQSIVYAYDQAGNRTAQAIGAGSNVPPIAMNDLTTTALNTPKSLDPRVNDGDPNNDGLTISGASNGAHGTVSVAGGASVTYTPATGYTGIDSFTYTISDGHGGTATATVSVTVG